MYLPPECIECIASWLGSKDRAVLLSCTPVWHELSTTSGKLWADLNISLHGPEGVFSLSSFLHRRRHLLGRLLMRADNGQAASPDPSGGLTALLYSLAGSSLHTLSLAWGGGPEVSLDWLARLPCLRSLHLETALAPMLGSNCEALLRLRGLTFLSLGQPSSSPPLTLPPAVLPPCLEVLRVAGADPDSGPLSGGPAALPRILRQLHLSATPYPLSDASLACLTALTALESLGLEGCCLAWVPRHLSALSALRQLSLAGNPGIGPHFTDPFFLRVLSRLSRLDLSCCQLASVSSGVLGLPALKDLRLAGNPLRCPSPLLPAGSRLERLSIELAVAYRWREHLAGLLSLHTLQLDEVPLDVSLTINWRPDEYMDVGQLLGALARGLPSLRVVDVSGTLRLRTVPGGVLGPETPEAAACGALLRERRGLRWVRRWGEEDAAE